MELKFCDLCQEAVPQPDLDSGRATSAGDRVVCKTCNVAMGDSGEGPARKAARRSTLISPLVSAVLAIVAIGLSLVAVVSLLARIEMVARGRQQDHDGLAGRVKYLEERQAGTRDGMIARARQAGEDAVYKELERFETYEQQLAELRLAVLQLAPVGEVVQGEATSIPLAQRLAVSDQTARVDDLGEQVLFLQARVYELLEESARAGSRLAVGDPQARMLVPEGEIGQLVAQLSHEDPIERVSALFGLANVDDVGIVRHVTPLLSDADSYIRALSARILERMGARSSVLSLIEALGDSDVRVRSAAVAALRSITSKQFRFDPRGPGGERYAAVKRWNDWWDKNWKTFLYQGE